MPRPTKTLYVPRPLPHQVPIGLSEARHKVIVAGRRWGKSVMGLCACLLGHGPDRRFRGALEGAQIRWIAPTYPLSLPMWESLKSSTYECWAYKDEVHRTITLPGGGAVAVRSADDPDSLRGVGSDGVVMDEAAFAVQAAWENGVRPTLSDRKGWAIFISSPNGYNWFHELFQKAKAEGGEWAAWQRPTSDNPKIPPEEIEAARRDMVEFRFRQEYLAEFTAPGMGMFRREWWNVADAPPPLSSMRLCRAWDFASTETKEGNDPDWTAGALLGIDQEARVWVLDIRRTRSTPDDRERFVRNTAAADGYQVPIWIPIDPGSAGVDVADHYVKRVLAGYNIRAHKETGDKARRAEPFAAQAERRNVWLVRAAWNRDWMNETDMFPTEGPDIHDDQCLVASTRVLTRRGSVRIDRVLAGDFVMTRKGWRKVTWAGCTGRSETVILRTRGAKIEGSPSHPVFVVGKGFIPIDAVSLGDTILRWKKKPSSGMDGSGIAIPSQVIAITASTSSGDGRTKSRPSTCTEKSGSRQTVRFPRAAISTTRTETRSITTSPTCDASRSQSIAPSMEGAEIIQARRSPPTSRASAHSRPRGTRRPKESSGIANTPGNRSSDRPLTESASARSAARPTSAKTPRLGHAPDCATRGCTGKRILKSVWNLSVEGESEFFANGILVHNCDAVSLAYRMIGSSGTMLSVPPRRDVERAFEGMRGERVNDGFAKGQAEEFWR